MPRVRGFIFGSIHNIQVNVPPPNIVAMFDTARDEGGYGDGQPVLDEGPGGRRVRRRGLDCPSILRDVTLAAACT